MPGNAPAATRALSILHALAGAPGPVSAATLARDLGLPRSSTYHLLTVMTDAGFVAHFPEEERWGLGVAAFEIGAAYMRHDPMERWGRPVLHRLARAVADVAPAVAHLGVLHGRETLYLATETPPRVTVTVVAEVGVRLPASLTASGRAILCDLPPAQVRALFPSRDVFVDRTGQGPTTPQALSRLLAAERRRGWAEEDGFIVPGYASVAVAARDHARRPVASIGLTFLAERADAGVRGELARLAGRAARDLSRRMGG